jgi:hypothetical protein
MALPFEINDIHKDDKYSTKVLKLENTLVVS